MRELERRGYRIQERRWRCRLGEIDLVAWDGATLVIVEVKTRSRRDYGQPADAVGWAKQRKLAQLADLYVRSRRIGRVTVRFDVVGVLVTGRAAPVIDVLQNAFETKAF